MSDEFEQALGATFGNGAQLAAGKAAIGARKWGQNANEDGETALISRALNPPSLGAPGSGASGSDSSVWSSVASSVASLGRKWDWAWIFKISALAVITLLVLWGLYKRKRCKMVAAFVLATPFVLASLRRTKFGSGEMDPGEWAAHLRAAAEAVKGPVSDMREAVDAVRADVLCGLAERAKKGEGYETVEAARLKSAMLAGYDAYARVIPGTASSRQQLRSGIDAALREVSRALPASTLRVRLEAMMDEAGPFANSWNNAPRTSADVSRVHETYKLRDDLRDTVASFGLKRARGKCLYVEQGVNKACTEKCARDAFVCSKHAAALAKDHPRASELEALTAHLASAEDPIGIEVIVTAAELQKLPWPLDGVDGAVYEAAAEALRKAPPATSFGMEWAGNALRNTWGYLVGSDAHTDPDEDADDVLFDAEEYGQLLPTAPVPGTDPLGEFQSSVDSTGSQNPAEKGLKTTVAVNRIAKAWRSRSAAKKRAAATQSATTSSEAPSSEAPSSETPSSETPGSVTPSSEGGKRRSRKRSPEQVERRKERVEKRKAQYVRGEDFLTAAMKLAEDSARDEMKNRFEARAESARLILARQPKAPFISVLTNYLSFVPIAPEMRAQQSTVATYLARQIVAFEAKTQPQKDALARHELIRKHAELVRREIQSTTIPLTVGQVTEYVKADLERLKGAAPSEHKKLQELYDEVLLALNGPCVPSQENTDAIRTAYDALVAHGKEAYERREKKGGADRWRAFASTMGGQWTARKIVYGHSVPECGEKAPFGPALEAGMAAVRAGARKVADLPSWLGKLLPSSAEPSTDPSTESADFGANMVLGKVQKSRLANKIAGAMGYNLGAPGGALETLLNKGGDVLEYVALVPAIVAAARQGESLIMKMLEFVVEGLQMLLSAVGGSRSKISAEVGAMLPELDPAMRKQRETRVRAAVKVLSEQRTFLQGQIAEKNGLLPALEAEADHLERLTKGANFGASPGAVQGVKAQSPSSIYIPEKAGGLERALPAIAHSGVFTWLSRLVSAVWKRFLSILDGGDVLDVFGSVILTITDFVTGSGPETAGWTNWAPVLLGLMKFAFIDVDEYMDRVSAWFMSRTSIWGLCTDPAGVLTGDDETSKGHRQLLTKFRRVAVPVVSIMFGLRVLQIIKAIFGTSLVHTLVCGMVKLWRGKVGEKKDGGVWAIISMPVDSIARAVGCDDSGTDAALKRIQDDIEAMGKELKHLQDRETDARKRIRSSQDARSGRLDAREQNLKQRELALKPAIEKGKDLLKQQKEALALDEGGANDQQVAQQMQPAAPAGPKGPGAATPNEDPNAAPLFGRSHRYR
jgi:hypothetical protein